MDIKQTALLARHSARLAARERFCGLPKRGIAWLLANALFWQPVWALADGIVVSGTSTTLGTAGNGVQVINIARPNGSGLSHNTFEQYNVGSQGVILNNATSQTQHTQLGGIIIGNANLQGQAATTILNEVTGNNRTQLKGYTEVAGQSARVIVANPYGITCNGCGFINTPQATLTTGKPVVNNGRLEQFRVEGGDISLEGAGLNASNIEQFDLITRSASLNAKLYAKKLNVVTGRNQVDANSLQATALAADGSPAPALAIDSSALGGMYAGAIRLVGTEQGVGVRLDGEMAASAGDINIDANGKLTLATTAASGSVQAKAAGVEVREALYAGQDVSIQAGDELFNHKSIAAGGTVMLASNGSLNNLGLVEAGVNADNSRNLEGDIQLQAKDLRNSGQVVATRTLSASAGQQLDNRDGKLVGKQVSVTARQVDNRRGLIAASEGSTAVTGHQRLDNEGGTVQAGTQLTVAGGELSNRGGTLLGKAVTVSGASLDNSGQGKVVADSGALQVSVADALNNQQGRLQAGIGQLTVKAGAVDNRQGVVVGEQVQVSATQGTLDNRGGQLLGTRLQAHGTEAIDNRDGGQLLAGSDGLKVTTALLHNQQGMLVAGGSHAELDLGQGRLDNQAGSISAASVALTAAQADNSKGRLTSLGGNLTLTVGRLSNHGGLIEARHALLLAGQQLDNSAGGRLLAHLGEFSRISVTESLVNNAGRIGVGSQAFTLATGLLQNQGGQIEHVASGQFSLTAERVEGAGGRVVGLGDGQWTVAQVQGSGLWHQNGTLAISGLQNLALYAGDRVSSVGNLSLQAVSLDSAGELLSDANLDVTVSDSLTNQGLISTQKALTLAAHDLTQQGGRIAAGEAISLQLSGALDNQGRLTSSGNLAVSAARIDNRGTLGAQQALSLTASGAINNQADSLLFSGADMVLRADSLFNRYADIYSNGNLSFAAVDDGKANRLSNLSGSIESVGDMAIKVAELENAKAEFEATQAPASRYIQINCLDCSGDHHTGYYIVHTTYEGQVLKDSPAARLLANRDLRIDADTLDNVQSLLAANRDAIVNAKDFHNRGVTLDNRRESISYLLSGVTQDAYRVTEAATNSWNSRNRNRPVDEQTAIPTAVTRYGVAHSTSTLLPGNGVTYTGTVQAGGSLRLNVSNELVNGSLDAQGTAQLTGKALDSSASGAGLQQVVLNTPVGDTSTLKDVQRIETRLPDGSVQVSFVPVDFSGAPFVSVDPTAASGFRLPEGDYGLFTRSRNPAGQYLVESNPALTDLSQFMSSDYLLGLLDYDLTDASRRLGDGRYETRLVADAVRTQTGQRFLAEGLGNDYEQFRYLMDNAIASKDALGLSVGVGLTSEQVAALTHDIVWMEERVVDGQSVLTPVLYLAKVDSRNLRGASLVQGRDVQLFSGADLTNVGTLRASENLSALSGGNLYQGGLAQANDQLSLMATQSIRNALAGEIRGDKVELTSLTGQILNDRTAISVSIGGGSQTRVDAGASIVAGSQLSLSAGTDLTNKGQISSGGDASLTAGGDIHLLAVQDRTFTQEALRRGLRVEESITQLGSSVTAEGYLSLQAGNDINLLASTAKAGDSLFVDAGHNVNLLSAADEHNLDSTYKKGRKKVHEVDNQSRQVGSALSAGDYLGIEAGNDVTLSASSLNAGGDAYVYAGNQLSLLAGQNSDYSLYDMTKKGSFGSKQTRRDEVTQVTHVGSSVTTGGDLTLESGGDQRYQAARLDSGNDLTLESGGVISFEAVKDLRQESHEKSKSNLAWQSAEGKGWTDETLRQTQLIAQGNVAIDAVKGLKIDVKKLDQKSVSQAIDAMVKADPNLAWLKDAELRGDVDWRQVQEIHDSWEYSSSGMGPAAQLAVAITAAALGGMAAASALSGLGAGTVLTGAGIGIAGSWSSTAAVSLINNKGDLGKVLQDSFSSDSLKQLAIAAVVGGLTAGYFDKWTGTETQLPTDKILTQLNTVGGVSRFAANQALQNITSTALNKALGQGGSFGDALKDSLYNTLAAFAFNAVGDLKFENGSVTKIAAHALVGGLVAEATGRDFTSGAVAAGANEALATQLRQVLTQLSPTNRDALLVMSSQLVGLVAVGLVSSDAKDLETGAWVAKNATQYNFLNHEQTEYFVEDIQACGGKTQCESNVWEGAGYNKESLANLEDALKTVGPARAKDLMTQIAGGLAALGQLQCTTTICEEYKFELIDRSFKALGTLEEVYGIGAVVVGGIAGMAGGGSRPGASKAYEYWASARAGRGESAGPGNAAEQTAGSITNVNPGFPKTGRTHNCVNCSIATDATLGGNPASALPIYHKKGVPLTVLEKHFGSKFGPVLAQDNIMRQIQNSGNGARGIVYGSNGVGTVGHVFNVVNQRGVVRFLDGQTGKAAKVDDYKFLQLLRTN
ncbi:DUF637 domain-containing protein [Pseudomonas sp. NPDC089406]|uniref:two-partner secretion domain-containing protein n=1 Tax=Pseudomonas sp. NPDC089406 TaxID=3364463 RepID=UPI00384F29C6